MEQVSAMIGNLRNMANDMGNGFGGDFGGRFGEEMGGGRDLGRHYLEDFWDLLRGHFYIT